MAPKSSKNIWIEFLNYFGIALILIAILAKCGPSAYRYAQDMLGKDSKDQRNRNLTSFGIQVPTQYEVHGIDVSHYQELIDWSDVASMKISGITLQFAFIKATEGDEKVDSFFEYNWKESKRNKLLRGAYHFYRPNINSRLQAQNFINTVKMKAGDLPPVLDIEVTGKYSMNNTRQGLKNWLKIIENHYGVKPIIYTNLNYYKKHLAGHFEDYPLWIAQYGRADITLNTNQWTFWQYSDQGQVNGIGGNVDFDAFNGNFKELKKLTKR